jgi:hypothetical protein
VVVHHAVAVVVGAVADLHPARVAGRVAVVAVQPHRDRVRGQRTPAHRAVLVPEPVPVGVGESGHLGDHR